MSIDALHYLGVDYEPPHKRQRTREPSPIGILKSEASPSYLFETNDLSNPLASDEIENWVVETIWLDDDGNPEGTWEGWREYLEPSENQQLPPETLEDTATGLPKSISTSFLMELGNTGHHETDADVNPVLDEDAMSVTRSDPAEANVNDSCSQPKPVEMDPAEEICFGMLSDIPVMLDETFQLEYTQTGATIIDVELDSTNQLLKKEGLESFGTISKQSSKTLQSIKEMQLLALQLYCTIKIAEEAPKRKSAKKEKKKQPRVSLSVIIYGPFEIYEDVGESFTECQLYLQDPIHCDRDVKYLNPHVLSNTTQEPVMTSSITPGAILVQVENVTASLDLFTILRNEDILDESASPIALNTILYRHQRQALTFMLKRELGWAFDSLDGEVWSRKTRPSGQVYYVNNITSETQSSPPPDFSGGLLADEMGLGKSLTIIALIAHNQKELDVKLENGPNTVLHPIKTTLIVAPLSLLQTWNAQLENHLKPGTLSWCTYHGPQKRRNTSLGDYDIVITTYETITFQLKKYHRSNSINDPFYSVIWHRIVLDEAHTIRNRNTSNAKAVCALHASNRWAVSATPIQNKLTDLASIFEFLRVYPFSDPYIFDAEISKPWQESDQQGVLRLKKLVNSVTLCRSRAAINLPKRVDEIHRLNFSAAERTMYDSAKDQTASMLDNAICEEFTQRGLYLNALRWLNTLRYICNHGLVTAKQEDPMDVCLDDDEVPSCTWDSKAAQIAFDSMIGAGAAMCVACTKNLAEVGPKSSEEAEKVIEISGSGNEFGKARLSECLFVLCDSCVSKSSADSQQSPCSHDSKCQAFEVCAAPSTPSSEFPNFGFKMNPSETPTKLKALLENLKQSPGEKSVVFSYWTFTLDLIEIVLRQASIPFTRLDGQMPHEKRSEAIQTFQTVDEVRVILVSITCGGTGLDLTAASRAYLMEPQWNPMMEEQALCRIYRLGQKKDVTTIRYRILNSFEEKVVLIQDRKKDLANLTFSNARLSAKDVGAGRLQYLRSALG